jgi:hypothetical protein
MLIFRRKKTTEEGYASNKQTQAQKEMNSNLLRKKAMVTSHKSNRLLLSSDIVSCQAKFSCKIRITQNGA